MSVPFRPARGEIRCEVARDVAEELVALASNREFEALQADLQAGNADVARMLRAEANALRSVVYAIRRHNQRQ